jgi:hypothetical protein
MQLPNVLNELISQFGLKRSSGNVFGAGFLIVIVASGGAKKIWF